MSSKMVNFRTNVEKLSAIDAAAKITGMDRSSFVRMAVEEKVAAVRGAPRIVRASTEDDASDGPTVKPEDCAHKKTKKTPYGIKICQDCGARIA